jgi:lipopolysaccharide/colanic/teichoic acid biosynthesis glycosyltransferase
MTEKEPIPYHHSWEKRWLDVTVASGALSFTSPIWPVVHIINRLHHERTLCHLERMGLDKKIFLQHKFETMYSGAEHSADAQRQSFLCGPQREDEDPRVNPLYRKIRFRSIGVNEIPQFLNVLSGEMSIVGPRPPAKEHLSVLKEKFPEVYFRWESVVFSVNPGIFSVNARHLRPLSDKDDFPEKAEYDIEYIYNGSLWRDLSVIADTLLFVGQTAFGPVIGHLRQTSE